MLKIAIGEASIAFPACGNHVLKHCFGPGPWSGTVLVLEAHRCLGLGWINGPMHRPLTGACIEQVFLGLMMFGGLNACACVVLAGSILLLESVAEHRRSNRLATAQGGKSVVVATKNLTPLLRLMTVSGFFFINRRIAFC